MSRTRRGRHTTARRCLSSTGAWPGSWTACFGGRPATSSSSPTAFSSRRRSGSSPTRTRGKL
ncbi:unnamed protein product [Ectocarpus fasciculatus]